MARLARLTLAGYPHHLIQRGNNGQPIFVSQEDFLRFLELLFGSAQKFTVAIHAYVLMPNHFHLLVTPQTADGLSLMMQAVGRNYVRWFNDTHLRTGTLWDGRYKSTVLDADRDLLACMVYFDLNPVRSGLVMYATDYAWSSHSHYIGRSVAHHDLDRNITTHSVVWSLGNTPFAREVNYTDLVRTGISATQQTQLTESVMRGWAIGDDAFMTKVQALTHRRVSKKPPGRPMTK